MLGYFEFTKRARRQREGGAEGGSGPPPPSDSKDELKKIDQGRRSKHRKVKIDEFLIMFILALKSPFIITRP